MPGTLGLAALDVGDRGAGDPVVNDRDPGLKDATIKLSDATGALTGNMVARERDYMRLEA
jgi:hypothetical protein